MPRHMSAQALLDELAVRERRVLEQLHELSGINQSPISPQQAYTSVQDTPQDTMMTTPPAGSSSPSPPLPEGSMEGNDGKPYKTPRSAHVRSSLGNLKQDLQRLQYLLQHSPLDQDAQMINGRQQEEGKCGFYTPAWQRCTKQREGGAAKTVAAARDKRLRVSPVANLSSPPALPETKRDKRETILYSPPPPLSPLQPCADFSSHRVPDVNSYHQKKKGGMVVSVECGAPLRRSTVLDMVEDDGEERCTISRGYGADDNVFSPRNYTAPRSNTSVFAACGDRERETDGLPSSLPARRRANEEAHHSSFESAGSRGGWRRSPVHWVASPAENKDRDRDRRVELGNDSQVSLCTSAVDAWVAHSSPERRGDSKAATAEQPGLQLSSSKLGTPPPIFVSFSDDAQLGVAEPSFLSAASPPHCFPGSPSPLSKTSFAATRNTATVPTSVIGGGFEAAPMARVTVLRTAETPQPVAKAHGLFSETGRESMNAAPSRRAASVLPRGVTHTTTWRGLRAFFARRSRVAALLTPEVTTTEEG